MQTVIDGVLAGHQTFGANNKRDLVILHGWGTSSTEWVEVAKKLSTKYRVTLIDLPGFGQSSLPSNPWGVDEYKIFLEKLFLKLRITNPILVGHSMGGKIAIAMAADNQATQISKLVLIAPSGVGERNILVVIINIFADFLKPLKYLLPRRILRFAKRTFGSSDYLNSGEMEKTFKKFAPQRIIQQASLITIPTLIIWGDKDRTLSINDGLKLRSLIPNSTLRVVWNTGHFPHSEGKDTFIEILEEFI